MPNRPITPPTPFRPIPLVVLLAALFAPAAHADSFTIVSGQTETASQSLSGNQTGTIQAGGTLSTGSDTAIWAENPRNIVINRGSISTDGDNSGGIASSGVNVNVSNRGTISTLGDNSSGIYSEGAAAAITNHGLVSTEGDRGYGIYTNTSSVDATITNGGAISTLGGYSAGVLSEGASAAITNNGTISTKGSYGHGIHSKGTDAVVTNSGAISTEGPFSRGIYSEGANAAITNNGSISTKDFRAFGIYSHSSGSDAVIANSGTISTTGVDASGVYSTGLNATVTNNGRISTTGDGSRGMDSEGANATITNSGTISTSGQASPGIGSYGADATINHSGMIRVTGLSTVGIFVIGGGTNTITVSGSVTATGAATYAIRGGVGDETLNLLPGARIVGTINLGGGTNVVNVVSGAAPSSMLTIASNGGTLTFNYTGGSGLSLVNPATGTVALVDTTAVTASQTSMGTLSANIGQAVNRQMNRTSALPKPVQVASAGPVAGIWDNDTAPLAWAQTFGQYARHDANGAALSFGEHTYGIVGGFEQRLGSHRAGIFGGMAQTKVDASQNAASTDSTAAFAGVYGQLAQDQWRFNGSLALGYADYNATRQVTDNLNGIETARADYHGWFLSPSVSVTRIFEQQAGFSWRPSAEVNYTYGRLGSYGETGTTRSNLSVGSRTAQVLNTRLQLGAHQDMGKQGEYEVRGGLSHTRYGDDAYTVSLANVGSTRYGMTGTGSVTGAYAGVGGRLRYAKDLSIVGDVEVFQSTDSDRSLAGYVGLEYRF